MFSLEDTVLAEQLIRECTVRNIGITTIESCTGGLISALLTSIAGSSAVIHSNIVTYANEAKMSYAHVPAEILEEYGAVSEQVAQAMALGGVKALQSFNQFPHHLALSVTGIAGPGGGTEDKPVGMVCFTVAGDDGVITQDVAHFTGKRTEIQQAAMRHGVQIVLGALL